MSQTKAQLIDPVDGSIVNADINASAAIAGSKISPDFGSQNIATTGSLGASGFSTTGGEIALTGTVPRIGFTDSNANSDFRIKVDGGSFQIEDTTNSSVDRLVINSSGNVGIGTASPAKLLDVKGGDGATVEQYLRNNTINLLSKIATTDNAQFGTETAHPLLILTSNSERMRITSSGNVGIGTSSPSAKLEINNTGSPNSELLRLVNTQHDTNAQSSSQLKFGITNSLGERNARIEAKEESNNTNDVALDFYTNSTSSTDGETIKMRVTAAGNVGIGTTSPATLLNLDVDTESNLGSGSKGIRLTSGSSNAQFVRLGSSYSNNSVTGPGTLLFSSNKLSLRCDNGNPITFHTGSTVAERMRITSTGRIGINSGGNPTDIPATSHDTVVVGNSTMTSGGIVLQGAADTSSNLGYQFYKGGSFPCARMLYEGSSNELQFHSTSTAAGSAPAAESRKVRILPGGDVVIDNGDLVVANGHGIDFSDTGGPTNGSGSSEVLDDYETGTFTPILSDNISSGSAASYQNQSGHYTKIGNIVHIIGSLRANDISNMTSSANLKIRGLPFVASDVTSGSGEPDMLHITFFNNLPTNSSRGFIFGRMENGIAAAQVGKFDNSVQTGANLLFNEINSGGASFFSFSATYRTGS